MFNKEKMTISVIVIAWNSEKYLSDCLKSVRKQTVKDVELIVIDNNSSDNSKDIARIFNPEIFIENSVNFGFAKANNQGISVSKSEYILTLNPDVILEPGFLEKARKEMVKHEKIGMVSGKLIRPSGKIDSKGIYLTNIRRFYDIGGPCTTWAARFCVEQKDKKLIGPCAAAGFYRRKMLEELKIEGEYFDEDFFAYVEDVDLAWRANIFGWKAVYCPDAKAIHFRGGSNTDPELKQYLSFRNRYLMVIKN